MKVAYVSRDLGVISNGASKVMNRNLRILREVIGERNVISLSLPVTSLKNVLDSFVNLGSYGIAKKMEKKIIDKIDFYKPDYVFIESSSFGSLFKKIKKKGIKTICFAHNVDTLLCKAELISRNPIISVPKYIITRINEKRTVNYTDVLICLTERDSCGFNKMFGRSADVLFPITFPERELEMGLKNDGYFLFVGSDFFPNIEGIEWFIKKVAPYVNKKFKIVGSCCNNIRLKRLKLPGNVSLSGYVKDIEQEYLKAQGVIAPIFKGSGMKTKTIEALSYGKSVYGTTEAFAGIDVDYAKIGGLCNSENEFIEKLSNDNSKKAVNEYSLKIFREQYSDKIFKSNLEKLFFHDE